MARLETFFTEMNLSNRRRRHLRTKFMGRRRYNYCCASVISLILDGACCQLFVPIIFWSSTHRFDDDEPDMCIHGDNNSILVAGKVCQV